jgi:hypothetical protein
MATKLVIEPIFEADFQPCSYGFRPKRSATQALEAIREAGNRGLNFVVDADIQGYFDSIQRETLLELLKECQGRSKTRPAGRSKNRPLRWWEGLICQDRQGGLERRPALPLGGAFRPERKVPLPIAASCRVG